MTASPAKRGIAVEQAVAYGLLAAVGLGAFLMALGYGLLKEDARVGPGLVPAVVGGLTALIAGKELVTTLRGRRIPHDRGLAEIVAAAAVEAPEAGATSGRTTSAGSASGEEMAMSPDDGPVAIDSPAPGPDDVDIFGRTPRERGRQLMVVFVALVVAVLLVPVLGFLVSFFLLSLFISAVVERRSWVVSAIVSFAAVAMVYGVFVGFLSVPLPTGLLGIGG